jgi:molybdopterin-guanine dinucleotide biosynthesis protein A
VKSRVKPGSQFAGAVLAGGKSRRMGRNKARLVVDGEPLWRRQMRVLREAGAAPVRLVQAPGQRALTRGVLRDSVRGAGPLAGLHTALRATRGTHLAVLAVDMPRIDAAWFTWLARHCTPDRGAIVRTPRGYEPLAAIYPQPAIAAVETRLARGRFSLQELVRVLVRRKQLRILRLPAAGREQVANWNTPADVITGGRQR